MLYSKWQPDRGGYVYYETSERLGLADDLPVPRLRAHSSLGVASTEIGRPLPLGAKIVGYGPLARGSIVPLDRSGLSGTLDSAAGSPLALTVIAAAAAVVGMWAFRRFSR